jgi:hypothetical protein
VEKLGINTTYKEYPVGHGVAPQNFYDFKIGFKKIFSVINRSFQDTISENCDCLFISDTTRLIYFE